MGIVGRIKWLYHEFGVGSVYATGKDAWLIILARSCRMFAYGTNSLIMALFFSSLKFTDYQIGLFMTFTMIGDVFLGVFLTMIADKVGRRRVLFGGSILMMLSGLIFANFENFWILLFAAVVGVISVSGGDFGPFRAIEESILSQLTTPESRSDVLSWYVTSASFGSCIGTEASGRIVQFLIERWGSHVEAYHFLFWIYSAMGALNLVFCLLLSRKCELVQTQPDNAEETEILLEDNEEEKQDSDETKPVERIIPDPEPKRSMFAVGSFLSEISSETRSVMYKLWFLLAVDSIADGMVPYSLTNYYTDLKFHLPKSTLGDIQSASYFLASLSTIFAAPLARRIGLVNTMVFTHVPSSMAVLLFPAGNSVVLTVILLFIRVGLNNMDQAPRSAFIAAAVKPHERTAVMGITSMLRTLFATAGPTITGILAGNGRFWIAFVAAGTLRLCYDFGLWALFINMKLHQHEDPKSTGGRSPDAISDEEELRDSQEMQQLRKK
jgi:MFS family permease